MTASRAQRGKPGGGASSATSADAARTTTPVLSPPQLRAVQPRGSDLQLIACAGSGKTETVAQRVAALIDEGVSPDAIVAFTFTERAALELKDRILKRVKERKGAAFLDRLGPTYVGTIHGYCFCLLQDHVPKYGNYDVLDEHRHAGILAREFFNLGLTAVFPGRTATADFIRTVDVIGNEMINVAALDGTPLGDWAPTQAAPNPILNNPYEEPTRHWSYVGGAPSETPGRRPASYWFKTQKTGTTQESLFAEEERDELPLVNKLRADVSNWRRSKYRGASKVLAFLSRDVRCGGIGHRRETT